MTRFHIFFLFVFLNPWPVLTFFCKEIHRPGKSKKMGEKKENAHTDIFHSVQTNGSCGNVTVCISVIVVSKRWNVYLKVVIIYREINIAE